jgi:hypothetical protein
LTNITNRPSHLNSEEDGSTNHEREAKPLPHVQGRMKDFSNALLSGESEIRGEELMFACKRPHFKAFEGIPFQGWF